MVGLALLQACAPTVAPSTLARVIQVESQGNPLAIHVNGVALEQKPRNAAEAAALARRYIAAGYSVDLGLMQVNSRNLERLGLTVPAMLDPCENLAAGALVLTDFFLSAAPRYSAPQAALQAALSAYNTGSFWRGFQNGYVARYLKGPVHISFDGPELAGNGPVILRRTPPPSVPEQPLNPYTIPTTVVRYRKDPVRISSDDDAKLAGNEPVTLHRTPPPSAPAAPEPPLNPYTAPTTVISR
jgi:type IV secretion system protein VirB1